MADDGLLPEEKHLLVELAAAWESMPPGQHQDFVFPPWGDTTWSLSHPGLSSAREVPKAYLNDLAAAGLITLTPPPPRTRRGSAPGGSVGITPRGRSFARAAQRDNVPPPAPATGTQGSELPENGAQPIDFVAWCETVLRALLAAQESSSSAATTGLRIDELASAIFGETEDARALLPSSTRGRALVDAHRDLTALGLIEDVVGNRLRVPRRQRDAARDQTGLWRSICANRLDPDEERILRALNRRSERRADDHAFLEPVAYAGLYPEVGLADEYEARHRVDHLLGELQAVGLARRSPAIGDLSARATYSGLAWEHRRWVMADHRGIQPSSTMEVDPIWRGRNFAVDERLCFVLMPFRPPFDTIYDDHVKPSVERLPLDCRRADDIYGVRPIMEDVWEQLCRARVVIAELTGRNANVFYEVGIAHTLGKPVVLITQNLDDVPFDLRHLRCITYEYNPRGAAGLEHALEATLRSLLGDAS